MSRLALLFALSSLAGCACSDHERPLLDDAGPVVDASAVVHRVEISTMGGGIASIADLAPACGIACTFFVEDGARIAVVPIADAGWQLDTFDGDCTGDACAIEVHADVTITVSFRARPDVVRAYPEDVTDLAATDDGGVWVAGAGALASWVDVAGQVAVSVGAGGVASPLGIASDGRDAWIVGGVRGNGMLGAFPVSGGTIDTAFLARVSAAGDVLFVTLVYGTRHAECAAIVVDRDGVSTIGCTIDEHVVVARYDPTGALVWSRTYGTIGLDEGISPVIAIARDTRGDVFIVGTFVGAVDLGGGPLTSRAEEDLFVARYAGADGAHVWSARMGAADRYGSIENATGVVVNAAGDPVVAALLASGADASGTSLEVPSFTENGALVHLDATTGSLVSARFVGGDFSILADASMGDEVLGLGMTRGDVVTMAGRRIGARSVYVIASRDDGEPAVVAFPSTEDGAGTRWGAVAASPGGGAWLAFDVWEPVRLGETMVPFGAVLVHVPLR